jgi:hypothetical protein
MEINILYLHGYCGNKQLTSLQTSHFRSRLENVSTVYSLNIKHHIINGFYKLDFIPKDTFIRENITPPYYAHCYYSYINDTQVEYRGIEDSINYLKKIIKKNNIDGIVAFSQASYITSILSAEVDLKFVVYFSGMPYVKTDFKTNINIPSYHIVGKKDRWYEAGLELYRRYSKSDKGNTQVFEHNGDHHFPKGDDVYIYTKIAQWIMEIYD